MTGQRGQFGILLGVVMVVLVLALIGLFSVCTPGENDHGLGKIQLVRYDDEQPRCYEDEDCYDDEGDSYHHDYSNHDRNRNRHRNRGAFSPGPFDRSPVTIIICPPGTQYCGSDGGRDGNGGDEPPPDEGGYA